MRRKRTSIIAMTVVLAMLTPTAVYATEIPSESNFELTQKAVTAKTKTLTESYGVASVQYALIDAGQIVLSGQTGINDPAGNVPLTSDTMYGIGSTSKMFLTTAVMMLVDQGKVKLDDPVVKYISDFRMKDERYTQITVRMLLNHSSGLLGTSSNSAILFEDPDTHAHDTLLDQLASQHLKADPGAYSVYSNDGFSLAEILVERVSGLSFTEFMHRHITTPLGMNHTKTPQDPLDLKQMATTYSAKKERQPLETTNMIASGGIYSTAEDLVKLSQVFTNEKSGVLSKESANATGQEEYKRGLWPEDADSSIAYGLGWDSVNLFPFNQYGIKAWTKGGNTIAYHASLIVLPEHNMSAAVTSSGGSSSTNQLIATELLLSALEEKQLIPERKAEKSHGVPVKAEMPKEEMKHSGIYGGGANMLMKLEVQESGQLTISMLTAPNSPKQKYTYIAEGSFVNEAGTEKVKFVKEDNGNTYLWTRSYQSAPGLGQLASSEYKAQKLQANPLSDEAKATWQSRADKAYVLVNEKHTSTLYNTAMPLIPIQLLSELPGYIYTNAITGADQAMNRLQIPGVAGRDTMEFTFFKQDGIEFVSQGGNIYASQDIVKPIYAGHQSKTTIQANGYARWFSIPTSAGGKEMKVNVPSDGSFVVYDASGVSLNHSVVSGQTTMILPEKGSIVFAGEAGAVFEITLK
ncbi:beta-lactamase family protein [Paenibacillus amylolyticus]|uniref:Beta-lactamase family protein n=1 Tax=Paenibacillus amylolyticus TaxID=1451 RepID=A0A5M9WPT2_PAEAM|nr:serine hydrolase domain-containing protein [Paenibacillus amylolyticus]KAA8783620.1 beta-lactamase family protein [Paenibacillus amylolyticus]